MCAMKTSQQKDYGGFRGSNPGPLAPKARIIPLDQSPITSYWTCSLCPGWVPGVFIEVQRTFLLILWRIDWIQTMEQAGRQPVWIDWVQVYAFIPWMENFGTLEDQVLASDVQCRHTCQCCKQHVLPETHLLASLAPRHVLNVLVECALLELAHECMWHVAHAKILRHRRIWDQGAFGPTF